MKVKIHQSGGSLKISNAELAKMAGYKTGIGGKPVQYGIAPAVGMAKGASAIGAVKSAGKNLYNYIKGAGEWAPGGVEKAWQTTKVTPAAGNFLQRTFKSPTIEGQFVNQAIPQFSKGMETAGAIMRGAAVGGAAAALPIASYKSYKHIMGKNTPPSSIVPTPPWQMTPNILNK